MNSFNFSTILRNPIPQIFILSIFVVSLFISLHILQLRNSSYQFLKENLNIVQNEVSSNLSLPIKIRNIHEIQQILSRSFITKKSEFLYVIANNGELIFSTPDNSRAYSKQYCDYELNKFNVYYNSEIIAEIFYCFNPKEFLIEFDKTNLLILSILFIFALAYILKVWHTKQTIASKSVIEMIDSINLVGNKYIVDKPSKSYKESEDIISKIYDLLHTINNVNKKLKEKEKQIAVAKLTSQLAHDIRSPLAALDMAAKNISDGSGFNEIVFNSAINRIRDLANELLYNNRKESMQDDKNKVEKVSICSMASTIVSEKRVEFSRLDNVDIHFNISKNGHNSFSKINRNQLSRVLSNLINNSIEARKRNGINVEVSVSSNDLNIYLIIKDNGKGIPFENLEKIFERGKSIGKKNGNGLGLSHAKETVEKFGGELSLYSNIQLGTTITIVLPKSDSPETFVSRINIYEGSLIVLVDDDYSIHEVWKSKIKEKIIYFKTPESFINWFERIENEEIVLIVDFDFKNSELNGIDIVKKLDIKQNVYLSTSHCSNKNVQESCKELGIKLIDKGLIPYIPIHFCSNDSKTLKTILVDDDPLVRMVWDIQAKKKGIEFVSYSNKEEFYSNISTFRKDSPIYIDSSLGEGINGVDIVKDLLNSGYQKVALATGFDKDKFGDLASKIEIRGKEAPW
ncbi:MAG: HAMP domain-containing histidine kinase [Halobacteriovoraceae bacterium]|nr:HAMP domain-containing histidine kinase [Halobacteriovoraceae bacterium]